MNELANTNAGSTAIAALAGLRQGLANVRRSIPQTGDAFLRLLSDGGWVYGAENIEVEGGSQWAVNPLSLRHGWVSWTEHKKQKNEVVGEVMVQMTAPLPVQTGLRDTGWEWKQQVAFQLKCMSGEDTGEQTLYKTVSVGGMNAVSKLVDDIMKQLDKDPAHPVPVIELHTDHYQHKVWGKTYVPVFKVVGWASMTDAPEVVEEKPAEPAKQAEAAAAASTGRRTRNVPETAPAAAQETVAARPVPEPAPAAPAAEEPVRRRRRA